MTEGIKRRNLNIWPLSAAAVVLGSVVPFVLILGDYSHGNNQPDIFEPYCDIVSKILPFAIPSLPWNHIYSIQLHVAIVSLMLFVVYECIRLKHREVSPWSALAIGVFAVHPSRIGVLSSHVGWTYIAPCFITLVGVLAYIRCLSHIPDANRITLTSPATSFTRYGTCLVVSVCCFFVAPFWYKGALLAPLSSIMHILIRMNAAPAHHVKCLHQQSDSTTTTSTSAALSRKSSLWLYTIVVCTHMWIWGSSFVQHAMSTDNISMKNSWLVDDFQSIVKLSLDEVTCQTILLTQWLCNNVHLAITGVITKVELAVETNHTAQISEATTLDLLGACFFLLILWRIFSRIVLQLVLTFHHIIKLCVGKRSTAELLSTSHYYDRRAVRYWQRCKLFVLVIVTLISGYCFVSTHIAQPGSCRFDDAESSTDTALAEPEADGSGGAVNNSTTEQVLWVGEMFDRILLSKAWESMLSYVQLVFVLFFAQIYPSSVTSVGEKHCVGVCVGMWKISTPWFQQSNVAYVTLWNTLEHTFLSKLLPQLPLSWVTVLISYTRQPLPMILVTTLVIMSIFIVVWLCFSAVLFSISTLFGYVLRFLCCWGVGLWTAEGNHDITKGLNRSNSKNVPGTLPSSTLLSPLIALPRAIGTLIMYLLICLVQLDYTKTLWQLESTDSLDVVSILGYWPTCFVCIIFALLIGDALALHCSSQDTDSTHVLVLHTCAEIFQPTHYSSTRESKSGTTTPRSGLSTPALSRSNSGNFDDESRNATHGGNFFNTSRISNDHVPYPWQRKPFDYSIRLHSHNTVSTPLYIFGGESLSSSTQLSLTTQLALGLLTTSLTCLTLQMMFFHPSATH